MSIERTAQETVPGIAKLVLSAVLALTLSGCFDDGKPNGWRSRDDGSSGTITPPPPPPPPPPPSNGAPTISGTPPTSAKVGQAYSFQPTASDPDGDALAFQVANKPAWAAFDTKTGRLSGTPSSSSTGTFADIRISVSDGKASSSLGAFSIAVAGTQLGSATLSWQPPTENTDGTPLTNLAGYVVRYGTSPGSLGTQVKLSNAGLTTYVVSDLTPATWYFQVSAYNASGVESAPSATASKTIT
jgi:hypothetical protein